MIPSRGGRSSREKEETRERRARARARWEQHEAEAKTRREESMRAKGMSEEEIQRAERIRRLRNSGRRHGPFVDDPCRVRRTQLSLRVSTTSASVKTI